ncbi:YsnF/AvaK domain-containing protein [Spirosoma soli]|uniref:YsnF/AvaK domain-containing protein n=1 Tax=Spirosoma soli TaxID=1770529 RepID=A0ABW5M9C3_9BACT
MNYEANESQQPDRDEPLSEAQRTELSNPILVVEEQIRVDKRVVETGVVRIQKRVNEEYEVVDIPTIREEVVVERVAVNQYVDSPPGVRYEGDTTIVPVLREVIVTEKRLLLVEEVHIIKQRVQENTSQEVTLRKEEVHIERTSGAGEDSSKL